MDPGGAIPCPDPAAAADPRADSPAPGGLKSPVAPATPDPALNPRDPESLTLALDEVLRLEKCYETPEGLVKRREVLKNLNVLVKQWIQVGQPYGLRSIGGCSSQVAFHKSPEIPTGQPEPKS